MTKSSKKDRPPETDSGENELTCSKEQAQHYLRQMMHIRKFEDGMMDLMTRNIAQGGSHLCAGQEAVAVGVCGALEADDKIYSNHRSHYHYLAKGGDLTGMVCELYGKAAGCVGGRGGSMHLMDAHTY